MNNKYQEFQAARNRVKGMCEKELLSLLDDLFGRYNLPNVPTIAQLRQEALSQLRQEWEPVIQELIDAGAIAHAIKAIEQGQAKRNKLAEIIQSLN